MNIKQIASIAIIAALPFAANAAQTIVTTNTPAAVGANGTVNQAATSGPYQTATIGEHDDEHIATTAYVKGAYNDTIAAVNRVDSEKQTKLISSYGYESIDTTVLGESDFFSMLYNGDTISDTQLVTAAGVAQGIMGMLEDATTTIDNDKQDKLIGANVEESINQYVIDGAEFAARLADNYNFQDATDKLATAYAIAQGIAAQRVEIYTTWDTNDKTQVAFVTASAQH